MVVVRLVKNMQFWVVLIVVQMRRFLVVMSEVKKRQLLDSY